jgi:hypothetical protein
LRSSTIAAGAALTAAVLFAFPAAAQQPAPSGNRLLSLTLPSYPTETGEPVIGDPQLAPKGEREQNCSPAWTCRVQLFGTIQHNGGVGLKGTAFTW